MSDINQGLINELTHEAANREEMLKPWTMRRGEQVFFTMPKVAVVRSFAVNHMIHHRGELSVYLRMNDIPIPDLSGQGADEQ